MSQPLNKSPIILKTVLGDLYFSAQWDNMNNSTGFAEMELCHPQPNLPPGMSVDNVTACVLVVRPIEPITNFVFKCVWELPPPNVSPESGECLDAQSWKDDHNKVMVGTEDYDSLSHRLPDLGLSEEHYPIEYMKNGFQIKIPLIGAGKEVSLHYVVASNCFFEPVECSCWYAVDINHQDILASRVANGVKATCSPPAE